MFCDHTNDTIHGGNYMFLYDDKKIHKVCITRPDFRYYLLLDRQFNGCKEGVEQAGVFIRQAFMIHNQKFYEIYMRLGANLLSDMEVLAEVIHQMHGEDDRYYDESNDDTPDFALIKPCANEDDKIKNVAANEQHHVNNDLTACVMRDMAFVEGQIHRYDDFIAYIKDDGAIHTFQYLKERANEAYQTLKNLLTILTTHTEMKDFGLAGSHNEFDLDTSNYFDKPNPTFLNPDDIHKI